MFDKSKLDNDFESDKIQYKLSDSDNIVMDIKNMSSLVYLWLMSLSLSAMVFFLELSSRCHKFIIAYLFNRTLWHKSNFY